eukprot:scaffold2430_cov159-Amphora_coffeaeformis.AAC.9
MATSASIKVMFTLRSSHASILQSKALRTYTASPHVLGIAAWDRTLGRSREHHPLTAVETRSSNNKNYNKTKTPFILPKSHINDSKTGTSPFAVLLQWMAPVPKEHQWDSPTYRRIRQNSKA